MAKVMYQQRRQEAQLEDKLKEWTSQKHKYQQKVERFINREEENRKVMDKIDSKLSKVYYLFFPIFLPFLFRHIFNLLYYPKLHTTCSVCFENIHLKN